MPFFNEGVDFKSSIPFKIAKAAAMAITIFTILFFNKTAGLAKTHIEFEHYHSSECNRLSNGTYSCGLIQGKGSADINASTDIWTNEPVTISVWAITNAPDLFPAKPYAWNGGSKTSTHFKEFTENGKVVVEIYTADKRHDTLEYTIKNIDMTKPKITATTVTPNDWTNGNATLVVEASDSGSGLHETAYSINGGASFHHTGKFEIKKNGDYTVVVRDKAGNTAEKKISVTCIDKEGPSISYFGPANQNWVNGDIVLNVSAQDNQSGLAKYPFSFNGGENYTANTTFKVTSNGIYKVMAKDRLGNISEKSVTVSTIDRDLPIIKGISTSSSKWVNGEVTITVDATDMTSGLAEEAYSYDGGKNFVSSNTFIVTKNSTINVCVRDKAGNTTSQSISIKNIDNTAPEVNVKKSSDSWTGKAVEISVSATDKESGLADEAFSFDGGVTYSNVSSIKVSENKVVEIAVKDKAGNVFKSDVIVDNFDNEGPVIADIYPENSSWTKESVNVVVKAKDSLSGLAASPYSFNGGSYTSSNTFKVNDNSSVTVSVKDKAGNVSTKTISVNNIDRKNPSIKNISKNTANWTNGDVKITVSASDAESMIAPSGYSFDGGRTFISSNSFNVKANSTIEVQVKDNAGNIASSSVNVSNIDKEAPTIIVNKDRNNWTNKDIRLSVSASDNLSGISDKGYSFNGRGFSSNSEFSISSNGKYSIKVKDRAGNVSEETVEINNIDKEAPVITTVSKSDDDWVSSGLTITVEASDALSGLDGASYSFDGGVNYVTTPSAFVKTNGTYNVSVRDRAGNVSSKTITISNIGKNPSEAEKERLEAEKEAERREKERLEAEKEKERVRQEIEKKREELYKKKESGDYEEDVLILEKEIGKMQEEYVKQNDKIYLLKQQKDQADERVRTLSDRINKEKEADIIGNVIESFHNDKNDIKPVEIDENGDYQKVSVKDYINVQELDLLDEEGRKVQDGADGQKAKAKEADEKTSSLRNTWLLLGIALIIIGLFVGLSLNYVYLIDGKKIRKLVFVKVKNDRSRILVMVPKGRLLEDGKYKIFFAFLTRMVIKDKTVYVNVDGVDNIFTTNEGKSFEYVSAY
ncbi:MAG: hypothetical protein MJ123_01715 [Lachnospiraceae bacterium]|nr:hypothetical protein [Lachnospiraceae bacterium]